MSPEAIWVESSMNGFYWILDGMGGFLLFWLFILGENKIESGPKSGLGRLTAQDVNNAGPGVPERAMWCDAIVKHQPKQEAGGYDDQQRTQSG